MSDRVQTLREENEKLRKINGALMRRVERSMDMSGNGFSLFQTAVALENEVRTRTRDLNATLSELGLTNAELKQAKEEADRARNDLANAIDAVEEGFALFSSEDVLVMCNQRFRTLLPELTDQIMPGLRFETYAELVATSQGIHLDDDMAPEAWCRMRLAQHALGRGSFVQRLRGDRWIQISERRAPNGGTAILQTDVTDMVRWERLERDKRLDEQARLVRATLDHMSQGVCVFDRGRRLLAWNDRYRELLGLPFDLLKPGVSFSSLSTFFRRNTTIVSSETAARLVRWVYADHERHPLALELRRFDGKVLDAYCRTVPDGGFVVSFTDVTTERQAIEAMHLANEMLEQRVLERTAELQKEIDERAAIEQALVEARDAAENANQSKTRFLARASHDLLQPLNAARLFISSLQEGPLADEQAAIVERVDKAFGSVETLLNTLLDISKIDAGVAQATIKPVALRGVFDAVVNEFMPIAEAKGVSLRVVPSSAVVMSDPNYLLSVVQNLVSNAVKYTRAGRVLIGARLSDERVRIEVHDSGIGIAAHDLKNIFDEFRRVESEAALKERGMGLGLAIVDRACRLLGHELSCHSQLGRGSCFTIALARSPSAPIGEGSGTPAQNPWHEPDGAMIALLIENDAEIRAGMTQLLERWGVSLLSASCRAEAREAIDALGMAPDVILADYHLDDDDTGLATAQCLQAQLGQVVPTILITADHSQEVADLAARHGAALLRKPVKPARLRALMQWAAGPIGAPQAELVSGL
ncbi:MAG: PAS-domain containing protein [Neomegalonema sp.]|nr:PAS-domain containing protein [Neomegalonema sp.]